MIGARQAEENEGLEAKIGVLEEIYKRNDMLCLQSYKQAIQMEVVPYIFFFREQKFFLFGRGEK